MDSCFATFAVLFSLFAVASCAPTVLSLQDACADVRISSLKFNDIAKNVSVEARNGSKDVTNFSSSIAWMEAKDMCDPESLKQKSGTCLGKILDVLTSYSSVVERLVGFQSCSPFASRVKSAMHDLHKDISTCVKTRAEMNHQRESHIREEDTPTFIPTATARWKEALLCHYTMDRLFSFSILTARVFAVGDPAHHTEGSAQKCM